MTSNKFDISVFGTHLLELGKSEKTIKAYTGDLQVFIQFFEKQTGDAFSPELVTSQDLRAFEYQSNRGASPVLANTWNRRFVSLNLFFGFCMTRSLISINPMERAGLRRREKQQEAPRSLSRNDYARLMRAIELEVNTARTEPKRRLAIRNRAMIGAMAYGALRVGEVCALRRSDLLLTDRKGKILVEHGKRDKEGGVNIGREGRLALADWLEIHDGEDVFDGLSERQVERFLAEIGQKAGVRVTPHMLRHTAVYRILAASNGNLAVAKQFARHSNPAQTILYTLPHAEDMERAVEDM